MQDSTVPNRASDAGPNTAPEMDLTDLLFEAEWSSEKANAAHKDDQPADVRKHLEAAKDAIERALRLL